MSRLLVVPAQGDTLQSAASVHFGRAPWFVFVDLDTGTWEVDIGGKMWPADVSLKPLYDPAMKRVKA